MQLVECNTLRKAAACGLRAQTMHPEDIKASIRKAGATPAQIARDLNVNRSTVARVIHGAGKSTRIARRICELSGLDPDTAWPGRYPEFHFEPIRRLERLTEAA